MKSRSRHSASEKFSRDESTVSPRPAKRRANIYDAVAQRVTQAGFIDNITHAKHAKQPLRPDEVLFKQNQAPIRFEETDYYHAHANLPADKPLPSGDLLGAIHAYISKLYLRSAQADMLEVWRCMDETALIAFGVLMEETARGALGESGDLAFVEADDDLAEETLADGKGKEKEEEDDDDDERVVGEQAETDLSRGPGMEDDESESSTTSKHESDLTSDDSDSLEEDSDTD